MTLIRVLICESGTDRTATSLRAMLHACPSIKVVGLAGDGEEALRQAIRLAPDLTILDVESPGLSGAETIRSLKTLQPTMQVLVYTACEAEDKLFGALCAGANGYLLKKTPTSRLLEDILEVGRGGAAFSPSIARQLTHYFQRTSQQHDYPLCSRELTILKLLVQGLPTKVIAGQVYLSEDGVKKNLKNIYQKLEVNSGKEAVAKAVREQIV